jgi:hypothetical protein
MSMMGRGYPAHFYFAQFENSPNVLSFLAQQESAFVYCACSSGHGPQSSSTSALAGLDRQEYGEGKFGNVAVLRLYVGIIVPAPKNEKIECLEWRLSQSLPAQEFTDGHNSSKCQPDQDASRQGRAFAD